MDGSFAFRWAPWLTVVLAALESLLQVPHSRCEAKEPGKSSGKLAQRRVISSTLQQHRRQGNTVRLRTDLIPKRKRERGGKTKSSDRQVEPPEKLKWQGCGAHGRPVVKGELVVTAEWGKKNEVRGRVEASRRTQSLTCCGARVYLVIGISASGSRLRSTSAACCSASIPPSRHAIARKIKRYLDDVPPPTILW